MLLGFILSSEHSTSGSHKVYSGLTSKHSSSYVKKTMIIKEECTINKRIWPIFSFVSIDFHHELTHKSGKTGVFHFSRVCTTKPDNSDLNTVIF